MPKKRWRLRVEAILGMKMTKICLALITKITVKPLLLVPTLFLVTFSLLFFNGFFLFWGFSFFIVYMGFEPFPSAFSGFFCFVFVSIYATILSCWFCLYCLFCTSFSSLWNIII